MIGLVATPVIAAELRVCADPDHLPFSNRAGAGFENRIMEVVAAELGDRLTYVWWPQRRGQVSEALNGGVCDIIPGMGRVQGVLLTYPPYYRSTYAFVTRAAEPPVDSFDDPALRSDRVGIQLLGEHGVNPPPAVALARRGIVGNVRGFPVLTDDLDAGAAIVEAVANRAIDVAIAWGPLAGYFARREQVPLRVVPVSPQIDPPFLPFVFDISMGVRRGDTTTMRAREVGEALARHRADIDRILADYGVPRLQEPAP